MTFPRPLSYSPESLAFHERSHSRAIVGFMREIPPPPPSGAFAIASYPSVSKGWNCGRNSVETKETGTWNGNWFCIQKGVYIYIYMGLHKFSGVIANVMLRSNYWRHPIPYS